MYAIITFLVAYMISSSILDIVYILKNKDKNHKPEDNTYYYIDGTLRTLNFLVDLYMFKIFLSLYVYFFGLMKKKLAFQNEKMTNFNIAIFYWGLFLVLLTFAHCLVALLDGLLFE